MGCICSKGTAEEIGIGNNDNDNDNDNEKEIEVDKSTVQLIAPSITKKEDIETEVARKEGSSARSPKSKPNAGNGITVPLQEQKFDKKTIQGHHQRRATFDSASSGDQPIIPKAIPTLDGDLNSAGWPQWLTEAAPEAIKGWVPRRADTFEKLEKIGQGTYSSVYRARDLETGKIVAMKKVRFVNMDPESVRFMAREIHILRKLDHPNVMKLEAIVTSRMSGSLYLVFEYMEHDLAGLAAISGFKFTEQQIKCYMLQLLQGLEHCHSRGILHRDIKGSNLLVSDNGVLKIGDFGLATAFHPGQKQALTSRVVTLWYRAPELLLGATQYGVAIDMWSAGCILAELFAGKPIMPGRTEVEQMHKIFKLCGSPSEDYWRKTKLPHATSFKPQQSYDRRIVETFKNFPPSALVLVDKLLAMEPEGRGSAALALRSEFFTTEPLPAESSSLPKYPPCKELDAKVRQEEARRQKAETVRRRVPESVRISSRNAKKVPTPEFITQGQPKTSSSYKYDQQEDAGSGFRIEPPRGGGKNSNLSYCASMIHPSATGSSKNSGYVRNKSELRTQQSHMAQTAVDRSGSCLKKDEAMLSKDSSIGYVPKKTRIHYSGPLMPPGGNIEEILREHERQIQQAVRKARVEKSGTRNNLEGYNSQQHQGFIHLVIN